MHEVYGQRAIDEALDEMDKRAPSGLISATDADLVSDPFSFQLPLQPLYFDGDLTCVDL